MVIVAVRVAAVDLVESICEVMSPIETGFVVAIGSANSSGIADGGKKTVISIRSMILTPACASAFVNDRRVVDHPHVVRWRPGVCAEFGAPADASTGFDDLLIGIGLSRRGAYCPSDEGCLRLGRNRECALAIRAPLNLREQPTFIFCPGWRTASWWTIRDRADHGSTEIVTTRCLVETAQSAASVAVLVVGWELGVGGTVAGGRRDWGSDTGRFGFPAFSEVASAAGDMFVEALGGGARCHQLVGGIIPQSARCNALGLAASLFAFLRLVTSSYRVIHCVVISEIVPTCFKSLALTPSRRLPKYALAVVKRSSPTSPARPLRECCGNSSSGNALVLEPRTWASTHPPLYTSLSSLAIRATIVPYRRRITGGP